MFPSKQLIAAKCYPGKKKIESPVAEERWAAFASGDASRHTEDGLLRHWFQTFDRDEELADVEVTQAFLPFSILGTLVVLLTMDEEEVLPEQEEEKDEIDVQQCERYGW